MRVALREQALSQQATRASFCSRSVSVAESRRRRVRWTSVTSLSWFAVAVESRDRPTKHFASYSAELLEYLDRPVYRIVCFHMSRPPPDACWLQPPSVAGFPDGCGPRGTSIYLIDNPRSAAVEQLGHIQEESPSAELFEPLRGQRKLFDWIRRLNANRFPRHRHRLRCLDRRARRTDRVHRP